MCERLLKLNSGPRRSVAMLVHEGDKADAVAQAFAAKHGLADTVVPQLVEAIVNVHNEQNAAAAEAAAEAAVASIAAATPAEDAAAPAEASATGQ